MSRDLKPVAFGAFWSMVVLTITNMLGVGIFLDPHIRDFIIVVSLISSVLLFASFIVNNQILLELGLLGACGVWTARVSLEFITIGMDYRPWLGMSNVFIFGGAFLLERYHSSNGG